MKGLLLKDILMTCKYCKSYLFITIIFIAVSFVNSESLFFIFYPCILCGMIPVNLLGYDERSKWLQYSETMPYTKVQIVSCKYLIGLGAQMIILIVTGISQAIRMSIGGGFILEDFLVLIMLLLIMSLFSASVPLPFIFKYGAEKGRMVYYFMIGVVCAGGVIASNLVSTENQNNIKLNGVLLVVFLIGIVIYALSWYLSVVFYKKREL